MAGILDDYFNPALYGGQGGGILSRLPELLAQQGPSQGFGDTQQGAPGSLDPRWLEWLKGGPVPGQAPAQGQSPPPAQAPIFPPGMGTMGGAAGYGAGMDAPPLGRPETAQLPPTAMPVAGQGMPAMSAQQQQQQMPAPQAAPPGPGFMDRLSAGTTNLSSGGNPLAALVNSIAGFSTGQRTDRMGQALQQQHATMQALVQAGVPPGVAQAAALNPEVLKIIAPQLYTKPVYQKTGANPLTGQESGVWLDPGKQTATPAVIEGAPVGHGTQAGGANVLTAANAAAVGLPPMGNSELSQIDALNKSGITGDEYFAKLKAISPAYASKASSMAHGDLPYPSGFIMKTPYGNMLTDTISAIKPGVTSQDFQSKQKARNYWTSGPGAAEIKAVNTAIYHADALQKTSDQMGGSDTLPAYINPVIQGAKNQFPQIDPNFQNAKKSWDATAETLSTEVSKALNGGTPHVADKEHWRAVLQGADGPAQRKAAISAVMRILEGRTQAAAVNYQQSLGETKDPIEFIDKSNREKFAKLGGAGGGVVGAESPAQPNAVPNRAALEAEARKRGLIK